MPTVAEMLRDHPLSENADVWYMAQHDQNEALLDDHLLSVDFDALMAMASPPTGVLWHARLMRLLPDDTLELIGALAASALGESFTRLSQRAKDE